MRTKVAERYFFYGLLLLTFIFCFFIFQPFWIVLVLGICFSIVLFPIYEWFKSASIPNWLASFLTVLLFTVVLCGPLLGIGTMVFNQSRNVYRFVTNSANTLPAVDSLNNSINNLLPIGITLDLNQKVADLVSYVANNIANIFSATVSAFFSFLLMLLIIFYLLKDGKQWKRAIVVLSPLEDHDDEKIIERLTVAVNGVMIGSLMIAVIQGVLMGLGLWIFHVPNPALWGLVAFLASFVPTIGTAFVSVPAIFFLMLTGAIPQAIGLAIWAMVVVGMVDNFLSPFIIGGRTKIPQLLVLLSILGGISLLGPVGVLVGPLTVSLLQTLILIYRHDFSQNGQKNFSI